MKWWAPMRERSVLAQSARFGGLLFALLLMADLVDGKKLADAWWPVLRGVLIATVVYALIGWLLSLRRRVPKQKNADESAN